MSGRGLLTHWLAHIDVLPAPLRCSAGLGGSACSSSIGSARHVVQGLCMEMGGNRESATVVMRQPAAGRGVSGRPVGPGGVRFATAQCTPGARQPGV